MKLIKPCSIISTFLDPIKGSGTMSSSSGQDGTIFLTDSPDIIKSKINKFAFSGSKGSGSLEDHRKYGGNVETDIPCKYLKYFEFDDEKYKQTCDKFSKGVLTCSETKKLLIEKLAEIITAHQENKKKISDQLVDTFYERKSMNAAIKFKAPKEQTKELYKLSKLVTAHCSTSPF